MGGSGGARAAGNRYVTNIVTVTNGARGRLSGHARKADSDELCAVSSGTEDWVLPASSARETRRVRPPKLLLPSHPYCSNQCLGGSSPLLV